MEIKSKGIQVATIDLTNWKDGYEYARLLKMYPTFKILDISLDNDTKTIEITFFGSREKVEKKIKADKKIKTATLPEEDGLYKDRDLPGIITGNDSMETIGKSPLEDALNSTVEDEEELEEALSVPANELGTVDNESEEEEEEEEEETGKKDSGSEL